MLILFSDTYPYGTGETFLADELPYVAAKFDRVILRPLHAFGKKGDELKVHRPLPPNVTVGEPLLPFDDKNRKALILSGLFNRRTLLNTAPLFFAAKEFLMRVIFNRAANAFSQKAPLHKRLWIFFNYLFILRSILGNKPLIKSLLRDCSEAKTLYFFWGDKSAMLAPFLKKRLARNVKARVTASMPNICTRFNGSDCYEEAKGYLPFRERIYAATDFGVATSKSLEQYIRQNYKHQPKILKTGYLGSQTHSAEFANAKTGTKANVEKADYQPFRLLSCSNVIELKRVHLILEALKHLTADDEFLQTLVNQGYTAMEWTHFGSGPMLENLKAQAAELQNVYNNAGLACGKNTQTVNLAPNSRILLNINLKGQTPHAGVMRFYAEQGGDIFLLLSCSEGLGVCLLEALSYGIPIIATAVGGIPELFPNTDQIINSSMSPTTINRSVSATSIGYLLEANPTAETVAQTLKTFATLPKTAQYQMRQNAYNHWLTHWDGAKLHSAFAADLAKL